MESERLYTRRFVLCVAANFAQSVSFALFLHFPGFLKELGAGESEIGVLMAVTGLSAVVLSPAVGRLMDRRGRRPVILVGNVLGVAVVGLYLLFDSLTPWLYAVRGLHGVAGAMLYTSFFTYAADLVPRSRTAQGLALFGVSGMLAFTVGGLVGDVTLARGGYPALFGTALASSVAALVLSFPLSETHSPGEQEPGEGPRRWLATLLQPNLAPVWFVACAFFFSMAGIFVFLKTWVMETGLGTLGGFFAVYTLTAIGLRLTLGWVPDRVGLERMVAPALVAFALGVGLVGVAGSLWQVGLAAVLCGLGHGFGFPVLLGLVSERARRSERGSAMAIYTAIDDGAVLVAGPVLGFGIEAAGYSGAFLAAAGLLASAVVVFTAWDRGTQPPALSNFSRF